jgi:hypothetical protein
MNKLIIALLGATFLISSCKKGEDDPFLSLRSRDARLKGEWKLVKKNLTEDNTTETFDGTTYTILQNGVVVNEYAYQRKMTIEKKGTFKIEVVADGETYNSNGHWGWLNTNKKKTMLILFNDYYKVRRLTNKELVLEQEFNESEDGDVSTYLNTLTFEKQ